MRFTVEFKADAAKQLERLTKIGDRSKSAVLHEALALEQVYQEARKQNGHLIIRTPDGKETRIIRA